MPGDIDHTEAAQEADVPVEDEVDKSDTSDERPRSSMTEEMWAELERRHEGEDYDGEDYEDSDDQREEEYISEEQAHRRWCWEAQVDPNYLYAHNLASNTRFRNNYARSGQICSWSLFYEPVQEPPAGVPRLTVTTPEGTRLFPFDETDYPEEMEDTSPPDLPLEETVADLTIDSDPAVLPQAAPPDEQGVRNETEFRWTTPVTPPPASSHPTPVGLADHTRKQDTLHIGGTGIALLAD